MKFFETYGMKGINVLLTFLLLLSFPFMVGMVCYLLRFHFGSERDPVIRIFWSAHSSGLIFILIVTVGICVSE